MALQLDSFRSKVARRLFLLFLLSALLPIGVLALLAWLRVGDELRLAGEERLRTAARDAAFSIMERATFLASVARDEAWSGAGSPWVAPARPVHAKDLPAAIEDAVLGELATGLIGGVFVPSWATDGTAAIDLVFAGPKDGELWARGVEPQYFVWGSFEPGLETGRELLVVDSARRTVYATSAVLPGAVLDALRAERWGHTVFAGGSDPLSIGHFRLPARYGDLRILVTEPRRNQVAALRQFRTQVVIVCGIALFGSLLASTNQIRRRLAPLAALGEGTRALAAGRLDTRVTITSDDEFAHLGADFNSMAQSLQHQFRLVGSLGEIGQAVLSRLEPEGIVGGVLSQLADVVSCRAAAVALVADDGRSAMTTWQWTGVSETRCRVAAVSAIEAERLRAAAVSSVVYPPAGEPRFLGEVAPEAVVVAFPVVLDGQLTAVIAVAVAGAIDPDAGGRLRRIADQVGVALANARLVGRRERMSRGPIQALARPVDAQSSWTAGHSERVAELGRRIGASLGMAAEEQELLYRGGLLHDIGKIGVPASVLDKVGKLTPEERTIMERHPELGVRILEPIHELADVLPIVWEHHEWWDGNGYPRGLAGEQISLHGRIFALADVYDALRSDRPYLAGVPLERVLAILASEVGSHFDPQVHRAFLQLVPELRFEAAASRPALAAVG